MPSALFSPLFPGLKVVACTPVGSSIFTAPGYVVGVLYNGLFLRANQAPPAQSCTIAGNLINLTFSIEAGDKIYALCVA